MADLAPEGALQCQLADRACVLMWRLSRAARLETELFTYWDLLAQRNEMEAAAYHEGVPPHLLALARDESEDRDKRFALALSIDLEIAENASLARALHEDGQASRSFDRLSRYESGLQRALNRTLDEFWRLRRMAAPRAVRPAAEPERPPAPAPAPASAGQAELRNEANSAQPLDPVPVSDIPPAPALTPGGRAAAPPPSGAVPAGAPSGAE